MTLFSGFSSGFDTNVTENILGWTSPPSIAPAALYALLTSTAIGSAKVLTGEWTTGTGSAGSNYVRQSFGIGSANWTLNAFVASTGVVATNKNQVTFPATNGTGAINLDSVGFIDASSGAGTLGLIFFADVTIYSVVVGIQVAFFGTSGGPDVSWTLL
jgi:hypothetical protein